MANSNISNQENQTNNQTNNGYGNTTNNHPAAAAAAGYSNSYTITESDYFRGSDGFYYAPFSSPSWRCPTIGYGEIYDRWNQMNSNRYNYYNQSNGNSNSSSSSSNSHSVIVHRDQFYQQVVQLSKNQRTEVFETLKGYVVDNILERYCSDMNYSERVVSWVEYRDAGRRGYRTRQSMADDDGRRSYYVSYPILTEDKMNKIRGGVIGNCLPLIKALEHDILSLHGFMEDGNRRMSSYFSKAFLIFFILIPFLIFLPFGIFTTSASGPFNDPFFQQHGNSGFMIGFGIFFLLFIIFWEFILISQFMTAGRIETGAKEDSLKLQQLGKLLEKYSKENEKKVASNQNPNTIPYYDRDELSGLVKAGLIREVMVG